MATAQKKQETHGFTLTRIINAPRDRVYQAWTNLEEAKQFSAPTGLTVPHFDSDLRVGGRYRLEMRAPDGTGFIATGMFKVVEPPSRLVYTWRWETDPKDAETLVTIQFKPKGKQTELSVTHEGFPTEGHVKDHESGWSESIAKLQAMFAG